MHPEAGSAQRILEQRALANVRALLDELEATRELTFSEFIVGFLVLDAAIIAALSLAIYITFPAPPTRVAVMSPCERTALAARTGEFENDLRAANPGITAQEMSWGVEKEEPFLKAFATTDCRSN